MNTYNKITQKYIHYNKDPKLALELKQIAKQLEDLHEQVKDKELNSEDWQKCVFELDRFIGKKFPQLHMYNVSGENFDYISNFLKENLFLSNVVKTYE